MRGPLGGAGNAGGSEERKAAIQGCVTKLQTWATELHATGDSGK